MLTTTSTYALIAMSTMVRNLNQLPMTARELAELGEIPTNYLSKIMRQLVRAGLVEGTRGIGGGFRFARPPSKIKLIEVVTLFEHVERPRVCPFGNHVCSDENPCAMHEVWGSVRSNFAHVLQDTDLASAAKIDAQPKRKGRVKKAKRSTASARRPARRAKRTRR
ncbi:MAG TPA: Rrf2 family transcriptional regulator [Phycisphaerae bacterium]|nr:Rrf2 family transcriptional regulator [Phycisphaerae bacterium]